MWAADGANIIWNMEQEEPDAHCAILASLLNKYIDVTAWAESYEDYYHQWLEKLDEDELTVFTLDSPLVASMLNAIRQFNARENYTLYYWFDTNRIGAPTVHWRNRPSPLSGEKLLQLPDSFSFVNRYIAPTDFLVFPGTSPLWMPLPLT